MNKILEESGTPQSEEVRAKVAFTLSGTDERRMIFPHPATIVRQIEMRKQDSIVPECFVPLRDDVNFDRMAAVTSKSRFFLSFSSPLSHASLIGCDTSRSVLMIRRVIDEQRNVSVAHHRTLCQGFS